MGKEKLKSINELIPVVRHLQKEGKKVVFTNGCFDILHPGHIRYLKKASRQGDILVVAINSDASVKRIKGDNRPINNQEERAEVLCALEMVSFVTIFEEDDPFEVIKALQPDVLVKGGDWRLEEIVGRDIIEAGGGKVLSLPFEKGYSTTSLIEKIISSRNTEKN